MKNPVDCLALACAAMVSMLAIPGCGMDSVQLGEYVKKEMQADFVKVDGLKSLKMKDVRLLKEEGINYSGVGTGEIDGGRVVNFNVTCKYDGKTVLWNATPADDSLFVLATKEKAKNLCKTVKEGVQQAYDTTSKKAGEGYEAAAKKAGECYEAAAKKAGECCEAAAKKADELRKAAAKKAGECLDAVKEKLSSE